LPTAGPRILPGTIGPVLRRYRGVIALGLVALGLVGWLLVTDPIDTVTGAASSTVRVARDVADIDLPDGVMSWSRAQADGTTADFDWGDRCDQTTGRLALPTTLPSECFAVFAGDNGGATATGVTTTSVRIVVYRAGGGGINELISKISSGSLDPESGLRARRGYAEILGRYYETYGRTIEVVEFQGTGPADDQVAAVADAEAIARELQPFAVLGGPLLTDAFADALARLKIMCWDCAPGQSTSWHEERAPYVWSLQKNPEQSGLMVQEYIGKRLMGRPAVHAGDPEMHSRERVFGSLHIALDSSASDITEVLERDRGRWGYEFAADAAFTDPTSLATTGRDLITKLKEAGVTTVVYTGDPFSPGTLTKIATEQNYFPEWIITGTALIDINLLPRTYDQRQWAHAFGPANLFVRPDDGYNDAAGLWQWWFDEPVPLPGASASLAFTPFVLLHVALQLAGPDLTLENFRDALFGAPTLTGSPTLGQVSFGDRGLHPGLDFCGVDDQAEVWWDATTEGLDELGRMGRGVWRWVDGGRRVLPGQWPEAAPDVFDPTTAVVAVPGPPRDPDPYAPLR